MFDVAEQHSTGNTGLNAQKNVIFFGVTFSFTDLVILAAISIALLLQLHLQFTQKVNWDEFFYLSHIYDARYGRLDKTLQMGHVYLFRWLVFLPGDEMAQITIGRLVMWVAQLGTLALIFKTARHFMTMTHALFAVLCFLGLGFVFLHGTSFRADPLAGLCMMLAVYVLAVSDLQRKDLIVLASALAIGAFVTIKVILFAPCLAALALMRLAASHDKKSLFIQFTVTLTASAAVFLTTLLLHRLTLLLPIAETVETSNSLSSTAEAVFISGGLFPRKEIMKVGFITGITPTVMTCMGIVAAIICALKDKAKSRQYWTMLALALPLLTFVFYRNAYPYFYAFIFPSAIILAGFAASQNKRSKLLLSILTIMICASLVLSYLSRFDETRAVQAQTVSAVHQIFPEAVPYFDRSGMIASFPKAGYFMSSWGLRNYKMACEHQFITEMETKTIPLLLDNSAEISAALKSKPTSLLDEDAKALRENYIPHWGHIWVAGKTLYISLDVRDVTILVPGIYTVESETNISILGVDYANGSHVSLDRGVYKILSEAPQTVTLRWGENLFRPSAKPSKAPIFGAF